MLAFGFVIIFILLWWIIYLQVLEFKFFIQSGYYPKIPILNYFNYWCLKIIFFVFFLQTCITFHHNIEHAWRFLRSNADIITAHIYFALPLFAFKLISKKIFKIETYFLFFINLPLLILIGVIYLFSLPWTFNFSFT